MVGCGFLVTFDDGQPGDPSRTVTKLRVFSVLDLYIVFVHATAERRCGLRGRRPGRSSGGKSERDAGDEFADI
jgi:hypothetical protein